jgi:hypothetical protein
MDVGTMVRDVRHFLGLRIESTWEMTEYEPYRTSAIRGVSGPIPLSGRYRVEGFEGGTRFTVTGELDAHGFF